jgi:hypothetical protein
MQRVRCERHERGLEGGDHDQCEGVAVRKDRQDPEHDERLSREVTASANCAKNSCRDAIQSIAIAARTERA